jgi:SAM-dependent methyltransferase
MHCPVCRAPLPDQPVQDHDQWTLYHCPTCHVQSWHPMKNPGADWYEECYAHSWTDWSPARRLGWQHEQYLTDRPAPGGKLLDVGCAEGTFLAAARDSGYDVTGVDFSQKFVQLARSRFGLDSMYSCSFEDFSQRTPPGSFDVITLFDVLEHQDNPFAFMDSVKRLLRSGGFLALSVPNREGWPPLTNNWSDLPPHHFSRWNDAALRDACARWGLDLTYLRTSPILLPFVAMWVRETLHINDVGRLILRNLRQLGSGGHSPEAAKLAGRSLVTLAASSDKLLLPLTLSLRAVLELLGHRGTSLYLLARLS